MSMCLVLLRVFSKLAGGDAGLKFSNVLYSIYSDVYVVNVPGPWPFESVIYSYVYVVTVPGH
jgi:hypothetical protein